MKELSKADHKDGWNAHLLKNELVILKQISHQNVVRIYDIYQDQDNYYIVQELMEGSNL